MALFKILKGPEAALPTTKKEGWAYVTNEGNFYVDISDTLRVKINSNADFSVKAENDSSNQKITDTYIKDIIYNKSGTAPYYTLRLGNGNLKATNGITDQVIIPVANTTDAGVVTIDKQTFAGAKTFNALITAKLGLTSDENISTAKQLISTIENGTAPLVVSSKTLVTNLNADTVDGLHASNNLFNAENSSTTILPTQRAIWSSLNDLLVAAHALVYRGIIDPTDSRTHPSAGKVGDVYIISKEGTFAGVYCEPGDMAIYYASGWDIVQVNINGAVVIKDGGAYNSAHTTTNAISRFEDTTGRVIKNSKVIIDDTGNMTPVDKNIQNLGSTENIWNTIYGSTFTGTSKQAISDDSGQVINTTYIKSVRLVSGTNPSYEFTRGDNTTFSVKIPISDLDGHYVKKTGDTMTGNLTVPTVIGNLSGNASTATKLATSRTISLTGDVTGSGTFDGSGNLSISTTANHAHSYLPLSGGTMTGIIKSNSKYAYTGAPAVIDTLTSSNFTTGEVLDVGMKGSGIYKGNGDNTTTGVSGSCNLIIKSWYGVGFATSCYNVTNKGITLSIDTRTGNLSTIGTITGSKVYGAVWNDYAEFRICDEDFRPGQVVLENGDDTLSIASKRLQRGCSIVSDTFGFAIGETDEAKCPIAVSGRVLAYGYESREEFKKHIGWPVCSGPNGTVSIMTEEEEEKYPSRIIGTISAVPDYETWGTGNVKVDGRIWIKVR